MDSLVVEHLGKCYRSGGPSTTRKGGALRDRVGRLFGRTPAPDDAAAAQEFWALRDVSFRVQPGTVLGVIGANGTGKTTLLKIIARVITPTTGRVVGVGRVVSLLELGAGFDPELAARENILMNAAVLGIPRAVALRRMDDILAFAEVERFVDNPLKYYSSGMYLRLAFSAAINMDPQILLADEILAVGDQVFQQRCLERVAEGGRSGLTVLFVSHDMDAILRVCTRVIWINAGQIVRDGDPEEVVDEYQGATWARADATRNERGRRRNRLAEIASVRLASAAGREIGGARTDEDTYVKILVRADKPRLTVRAALDLTARNQLLFRVADPEKRVLAEAGYYEILVKIPAHLLAETSYSATVNCTIGREGEEREFPLTIYNALKFVAYANEMPTTPDPDALERTPLIAPQLEWMHRKLADASGAGA
jgi:lipopolysaccharide transport system ATP-binding protein